MARSFGFGYSFFSNDSSFTTVYPKSGQVLLGEVNFNWNSSDSSDSYRFQLSNSASFSPIVVDTFVGESTQLTLSLFNTDVYYWRVLGEKASLVTDTSEIQSFRIVNPLQVDSLFLWLTGDSVQLGPNNKVVSWLDQSDSNRVITQNSVNSQGTLLPNHLNGYPAVDFTIPGAVFYNNVATINSRFYYISTVYNFHESVGRFCRFINSSTPANRWYLGPYFIHRLFQGNNFVGSGLNIVQDRFVVNTAYAEGDSISNIINGVSTGKEISGLTPKELRLGINSSARMNGAVAEIIMVGGAISEAEQQSLDLYLMDKYSPPVNLGPDRLVCSFPDSLQVDIDYALNFNWSTGDTTHTTLIDSAGTYYLTITDQFERSSVDSIVIVLDTNNYQVDFGFQDTIICKGDSIQLEAGPDLYSYSWSTMENTPSIIASNGTLYTVTVTNCVANTSVDSVLLILNEPRFSLGADTTICFNERFDLQADSNFTNVSYSWSTGVTASSIQTDTTGLYSLTVTDAYHCAFSDTVLVISDSSLFDLSLGPDTSLCEGNSIRINGDNVNNITQYVWGTGNTNPSQLIDTAGIYTITVSNALCSFSDTVTIGIKGLAPAAIFSSQNYCLSDSVVFSNSSSPPSGDSIISYSWDFSGLGGSNIEDPKFSFPDTGIYQVSLTVVTDKGCQDSVNQNVDILPLPIPDFSFTGNCSKRPIQFSSNSTISEGFIQTFSWDFDNGQGSNLEFPTMNFDSLGTYDVLLVTISDAGCIDSIQKPVVIDPTPVPSFVFEGQCLGDSSSFTSTTKLPAGSIIDYLWLINNQQLIDSIAKVKFTNTGDQAIILRLTSDKNCLSILRDTVQILQPPTADFVIDDICQGNSFSISDSSAAGSDPIANYLYTFSKDSLIAQSSDPNPVFKANELGEYTIKQLLTSINACTDSIEKTAFLNPNPTADFRIINNRSGAPYTLEVENRSVNATSYLWNSGSGDSSNQFEADFVYPDSGNYEVELVARSDDNCFDTISRSLTVTNYFLDASIDEAQLIPDLNGSYRIRLRLANRGNNKIEDIEISLDPENQTALAEEIVADIYKGDELIYTLNTFLPAQGTEASFICFNINRVNGVSDDVKGNNQFCVSAFPNSLYLSLYPNPAEEWMSLDFVLLQPSDLSIRIFDSQGRVVLTEVDDVFFEEGYHQRRINVLPLRGGLYILRFTINGKEEEIKFVKR